MAEISKLEYDTGQHAIMKIVFFGLHIVLLLALAAAIFIVPEHPLRLVELAIGLQFVAFVVGFVLDVKLRNHIAEHMADVEHTAMIRAHITELFEMTDRLQAAEDNADAGAILTASAQHLLPEISGALYVFNNSRDRLDLAKKWSAQDSFQPPQILLPGNCWALKRGKAHVNDPAQHRLCCAHHVEEMKALEVPMTARGEILGLLLLATDDEEAFAALRANYKLPRALSESMSLAISNISLREKLRTQSLRDPLTGLYNRRYMEDALERYTSLAERKGSATSVLMIDLDNFKKINDEHGHAKGDAILRDVAAQLVGAVRPSDVVSRFGGEELVVIMPDCNMDDASRRAEILRGRIEGLSEAHGFTVTASFGVATVPDSSSNPAEIIPMADTALYRAKLEGKNRVVEATHRLDNGNSATDETSKPPMLAVG